MFSTGEIKQSENLNPIDGKVRHIRVFPIFDDSGKGISVPEHNKELIKKLAGYYENAELSLKNKL